jgi:predicted 3-demethylubiquinone-9 3-methyltransferase (glyoxalase superfamily)
MQKITPFLWFDTQAKEAVKLDIKKLKEAYAGKQEAIP